METVAIALVAFVLGVLAGALLSGLWIGQIMDSVKTGLAVSIVDEIENRQGYRKAHPEAGR